MGKKRAEEDEEKKQTYWFNFLDQQDCASIKQEIQTALGELRVNSEYKKSCMWWEISRKAQI